MTQMGSHENADKYCTGIGTPLQAINPPVTAPESATMEPTERSIPQIIMTYGFH